MGRGIGVISAERLAARKWISCACGCGQRLLDQDKHGRPRRRLQGHLRGVKYRRHSPLKMSLAEAQRIAGRMTKTTKMPGWSYSLDAFACKMGNKLAEIRGSTCEGCYARKGFYLMPATREAVRFRLRAIRDYRWVDAMVEMITFECDERAPWFRWHDSGDIMSLEHLRKIIEVVRQTPQVKHWLPTREYYIVLEYLRDGGVIPDNLCIRLSSHWVSIPAVLHPELKHLPTSTVHLEAGAPVRLERRRDSIECRAYTRDNDCGPCRACWSPKVRNVSYLKH